MKLIWHLLALSFGLSQDTDDLETLAVNRLDMHSLNLGRAVGSVSNILQRETTALSKRHSELLALVIRNSGGTTPWEVSPARFSPSNGKPEYVASFPGSEPEAYRFAMYSGISYCLPGSVRSMTCKICRRLGGGVEVIQVFSDLFTRGRAILMRDKHRNEIVLAFRGSLFIENWISNLQFFMTSVPYANGAKVHHGFKQAATVLLDDIIPPLQKALSQYPDYKLIVTGHSLGGSLATLAASEFLYHRMVDPNRLSVFTYGEPRTGNPAFARWYNSHPIRITRIVNENDIVPHVPPALFGFAHHATEDYIQNNRSSVCPSSSLESVQCSLSRFPFLSVLNHLRAWDLPMGVTAC